MLASDHLEDLIAASKVSIYVLLSISSTDRFLLEKISHKAKPATVITAESKIGVVCEIGGSVHCNV